VIVTLLTDYGHDDDFAGICHAVIASVAPEVRVIDLTHGIPRFDVRRGALALRDALPYLPVGVHVAVVDPQVGTERRAVALSTAEGRMFVGPDNGLLSLAADRAGGVEVAVDITRSPHRLEPVSATFHGRDLFAPVAARLAAGSEMADAGTPLDPGELQTIELPRPSMDADTLVTHVLYTDGFGNATLDAGHEDLAGSGLTLGRPVDVQVGGRRLAATYTSSFADVEPGDAILYEDAQRALALAINRGNAAAAFGLAPDTEVRLRPR